MNYKGQKIENLADYIEARKKDYFDLYHGRGHNKEYTEKYWNSEGIVWTVQDYYSAVGEFTENDKQTIKREFGECASDVIALCEDEE